MIAAGGTASVAANATLKAIAFKSGYTNSAVASGGYTVAPAVATPTYSPVAGAYPASDYPKMITISTTAGANIRYTTNGTTPTPASGTLIAAGGTASVPVGATLKAIAFKSGWSNSAVASGVYSGIVATPAFSPAAGTYPASDYPKTITIATGTAGSNIRYTTNGTAPTTTTGTLIAASSGTASVPGGATLKAIAFKSGYSNSAVQSGVFAVVPQVAPVIIDDDCGSNGCYPNYAHVTMSTGTANATIFYTASTSGYVTPTHSGATPTGNTAIYSGPIEVVFQRKYFSAVGYKAGLNDSGVTQFDEDNTNPNLRPAPIQPAAASAAMGGGAAPEWSAPARTVGYVLDKAGNRLSVEESGVGTQSYVPNNLNQYESVDGAAVNHGASHETTGHEGVTYSYVGDTYLAQATSEANTYTLYYDALGRCVKRKLNGVSKYYLFEGEHWILEYDATGASASNVLYGLGIDEIIARGVSGQPQWPLPDRNGNTSVVTTDGGAILEQYRYDAFGAPTITDANGAVRSASAIKNPFLFTGREWAPANLGFYEYRNRAYHPGLGRFMSEDPIGFQMAGAKPSSAVRAMFPTLPETFEDSEFNLYRYVSNDPLDRVDPMGLDPGPGRDFIVGFDYAATGGIATGIMDAFDPSFGAGVDTGSTAFSAGGRTGLVPGGLRVGAGKLAALGAKVYKKYAPFSKATKDQAKEANRQKNDGKMRDARTGEEVQPAQQSKKGVTPPGNEAHVDHIQPRSKGGDNSPENAQILSRKENLKKAGN